MFKRIASLTIAFVMILSMMAVGVVNVSAAESSATILDGIDVSDNKISSYGAEPFYSTESEDTSLFGGWHSFLDGVYLSSFQRDVSGCSESEMKSKALQYVRIDDRTTNYKIFAYLVKSDDDSLPYVTKYQNVSGRWQEVEATWYACYIWSDAEVVYFPIDSTEFFDRCNCLNMNFNGFDFSKVKYACSMFSCLNDSLYYQNEPIYVDTLDLSPMNLVNCEDMTSFMAYYDNDSSSAVVKHVIMPHCVCNKLVDADDAPSFGGSNTSIFESIDFSGFYAPNLKGLPAFFDCGSLRELDLSNFNLNQMENISFGYSSFIGHDDDWNECSNLTTIYVSPDTNLSESQFDESAKNDGFNGLTSLVGGNGTAYSNEHIDWTYARIDGKDGLPGYFTAKLPEEPVDESKITASGNNGKSIVTLDYDTANLRVTVPSVLPVSVDSDNNVTVANNAKIVNHSNGSVDVTACTLNGNSTWSLVDFDTDFTKVPTNTKQYGFELSGYKVPSSGNAFNNQFGVIDGKSELPLTYNANVAIQSEKTSGEDIGSLVFTVAWHK